MRYDVDITRLGLCALFDLKGTAKALQDWIADGLPALPSQPNTRIIQNGVAIYHIGRNHWILRAPLEQEGRLEACLKPETCPAEISVVRVSDTLSFFRLTGPQAIEVMAIASPLDLHDSVFGPDAVSYTEVFGLKALVTRCEGGFECAVEQSFGDFVQDYLSRATV